MKCATAGALVTALLAAAVRAGNSQPALGAASSSTQHNVNACATKVFPAEGTPDPRSARNGSRLVLSGGGGESMPVAALRWMRAHLGAVRGRAGNVVVLRAYGGREYTQQFYRDGRFAWVQELVIPPCAAPHAVDGMASYVERADAVFFSGGDQSNYVRWKNSALIRSVRTLYESGGIVGGGSAGLAIQGAVAYDSVAANRLHPGDDAYAVDTANAVRDPLEPEISFTHGLFAWPVLAGTITDTHFAERNRFGRLVAFLARIHHERLGAAPFYGLGVDRGSVVLVEPDGMATMRCKSGSRGAYLVRAEKAAKLAPGAPLRAVVQVAHIARDGERFDLLHKKTEEGWHSVVVDGSRPNPYDTDPYR